jgi:hypothetical protein
MTGESTGYKMNVASGGMYPFFPFEGSYKNLKLYTFIMYTAE